jgi:HPt (histidine-containing phosphotransfer) domain-containing protein
MTGPNLDFIEELAAGDNKFKNKLISIIRAEIPSEILAYRSSMEVHDYRLAAAHVHKLKHKISILAMTEGYQIATSHEENLREGDLSEVGAFDQILMSITKFIDDL